MRSLTLAEVLELHHQVIEQSGGAGGILNLSALESALAQPRMTFDDAGTQPDFDGNDYGLYQIYGTHKLTGPDTLLYVGEATDQTFADSFRRHNRWLVNEYPVKVFLGHIYKPGRHTARDLWASWTADVCLAERILIYKYSPPYNSSSIARPPKLGQFRSVALVHHAERHKLDARDFAPDDWE